ncbi:hypothetical protein [Variovorax guangxiensis]|uniref:hypothetical protein n=1 Tax=Variovorax guangxiensis TaxID=1775474 RepID=UPI002855AB48|nr:hypothetical protein [Variovorax guangxiensis]MDR6859870.1 hypothetical protein [Variovorax guangxiensis]
MATSLPPGSLDFLQTEPVPVTSRPASPTVDAQDRLPQGVVDRLMKIPGVDGVWVERDAQGKRFVVLHYTPKGPARNLPSSVEGLPTRIVGGEPIRAF